MKNGVSDDRIVLFVDQEAALGGHLKWWAAGDLLVVFGKRHAEAWLALEKYQDTRQHDCTVH